jgi:manganese oxidase
VPGTPPTLNGRTAPAPIALQAGVTYRLRLISIDPHGTKTVRLLADAVAQRWHPIGKDGSTLPSHQATMRPARVVMGTGETWDFEYTPSVAEELTLEITTAASGLPPVRMRVPVHVRAR